VIVLDASVLIAFLDSNDALHADARALLEETVGVELVVGTITLAEILVGPVRAGMEEKVLLALQELGVREVPLPSSAAVQLASLRAETGLKLPDCCVLLLAIVSGSRVASFDTRLNREAAHRGVA
jgi:predicted nucleic acid-binding protein